MVWLPYDPGLSAAAETLVGILKRVIVSPAVWMEKKNNRNDLSPNAEGMSWGPSAEGAGVSMQLGVWGSAVTSPNGSGRSPVAKRH